MKITPIFILIFHGNEALTLLFSYLIIFLSIYWCVAILFIEFTLKLCETNRIQHSECFFRCSQSKSIPNASPSPGDFSTSNSLFSLLSLLFSHRCLSIGVSSQSQVFDMNRKCFLYVYFRQFRWVCARPLFGMEGLRQDRCTHRLPRSARYSRLLTRSFFSTSSIIDLFHLASGEKNIFDQKHLEYALIGKGVKVRRFTMTEAFELFSVNEYVSHLWRWTHMDQSWPSISQDNTN